MVDKTVSLVTDGLSYRGKEIKVELIGITCDAPVRAFVKCTKNHKGYSSCERCKVYGEYYMGRVGFFGGDCTARNGASFRAKIDEHLHKGVSLLEKIPRFNMITGFPLDYLHLICLGVVRKFIKRICCGKKNNYQMIY